MRLSVADRGSNDPLFDGPFVDADEWRDEPVRHRFVHGGFEGTDARFAVYFPPPERYQGRFFQPLMPVSGTEYGAATGALTQVAGLGGYIGFCSDSGAYLVESNLGSLTPFPGDDTRIVMHRTSAAVARYSRQLAAEMYGDHRAHGYVYGGSGHLTARGAPGFAVRPDPEHRSGARRRRSSGLVAATAFRSDRDTARGPSGRRRVEA